MKKVVLKLDFLDEKIKQKAMKNVSSLPGTSRNLDSSKSFNLKQTQVQNHDKDSNFDEKQTGVDSIAMDMKDKKLTVTGDVDPVTVVSKLRKICHTEILSVGPSKEPEKKKEDGGAAGGGGGGDKKKEDEKKKADEKKKEEEKKKAEEAWKLLYQHQPYPYYNYQQQQQPYYQYNHPPTPYYSKVVHDETPNCVIC